MRKRLLVAGLLLSVVFGVQVFASGGIAAAGNDVGFAKKVFVDPAKHGGEPLIWYSKKYHDLIFSSHEGDTHLYRPGAPSFSTLQFICPDPTAADCYGNHVWVWTSYDNGKTWKASNVSSQFTGFSDPDLTEDAAGNVYDTGIDLANDALFSSPDGGKTWPVGTAQCHEGDRPWLAGGKANEVFLATDTSTGPGGHELFHSTDAGASCPQGGPVPGTNGGIPDSGTMPDGKTTWSGFGKLVYDPHDGSIIEPAIFTHADKTHGVGISRLADAAAAFSNPNAAFVATEVYYPTTVYSPFGAPTIMSMDSAENLYFAWDTRDSVPNSSGGCSQNYPLPGQVPGVGFNPTPLPNHIRFEMGKHVASGRWQWLPALDLAHQGNANVLWPWSVVGSPGNVSVVWYQDDKLTDLDCDSYNGQTQNPNTYIYEAHILNALDPATRSITVTNASGTPIHQGGICNSGTTCAATGQDRRLGDYFTNTIDGNGCVVIASGDTTTGDAVTGGARITSLPIFIGQNSGPSLTGGVCGVSTTNANVPPPAVQSAQGQLPSTSGSGWLGALELIFMLLLGGVLLRRRSLRSAK